MKKRICAGLAGVAWAASSLAGPGKPGLWEMSIQNDNGGLALPQLSPEQLNKLKQLGIKVPDGVMSQTHRICVTPEMADRDGPPAMSGQDQCKSENFTRDANSFHSDVVCNGAMSGKGKINGKYESNTAYSVLFDFNGMTKDGHPIVLHSHIVGKWIADDCGDVKPPAMPPPSTDK